jgi:hypothetical protein
VAVNENTIREDWLAFWKDADERARARKHSQVALLEVAARYRNLPPDQRAVVNEVLVEAVSSNDATTRFDALALIEEFQITSASSALRKLHERLVASQDPGAPYERVKIERILSRLEAAP